MVNSYEAECAFIGSLIIMADQRPINELFKHVNKVEESDFSDLICKITYRYIKQMVLAEQPFDVVSLYDKIESSNMLNGVEVKFSDVGRLANEQSGFAAIESHQAKIIDCSMRRSALQEVSALIQKIEQGEDVVQSVGNAESAMSVLLGRVSGDDSGLVHMRDLIPQWIADAEAECRNEPVEVGFTSGFSGLDEMLGEKLFRPKSMLVIGANPGKGKTSLMITMSTAIARQYPEREVHVYSLEMPKEQIVDKLMVSAVNNKKARWWLDEDWARIGNQIQTFESTNLYVCDKVAVAVEQIKANARAKIAQGIRISAIFIDYATLLKLPKADRRDLSVGMVSMACTALAKEIGCLVVLLSQLSRENEKRVNKRPQNSDLRDSGQIEQDAGYILFPYFDYLFHPDSDCGPFAELGLNKNRFGATGVSYAKVINGVWNDCDQQEAKARLCQ